VILVLDAHVLVVDDEPAQAEGLRRVLAMEGFRATAVDSPTAALEEISMRRPDAIVSDFRMGSMNGLDLYRKVRETHPEMLFVIVTGFGSLETAVEALKEGVHDFITKPVDTDALVIKLKKALKLRTLETENVALKRRIGELRGSSRIIAEAPVMVEILASLDRIAQSSATVLVTGESGTGKEKIARALHERSPRASEPYIKVNCAAIPENLLESELFGHEEGAFTGAKQRRDGKFSAADGGTIFLDEIGEMPLHLQSKFLRVLQEREFERVGSNETLSVDVRVVAATNRDLQEMVKEGEFREDLFYRLNVIPLHIPPLRGRVEDVVPLAEHFRERFCEKHGRELAPLSPEVVAKLEGYGWPGNVRELENCMERAVVLAAGDALEPADFHVGGETRRDAIAEVLEYLLHSDLTLEELERRFIMMSLERCGGNVSQTARVLGLTRRTLQYRLEKVRGQSVNEDREDPSP
jgi:DNA-binding NtrC family response regulator